MAVTQNSYVGDGSTTTYSFTFPYLKTSEVKASLDATVTTAFTTPTATTVQFNTAPASGVKIKIYRETDSDSLTATFYAGSAIKSEDLNDNFTQNLYATQEVTARYLSNLGGTMVGDFQLGEDVVIKFEGASDNAHETTLTVTDPTADRTITLPNVTGTVITTGDTGTVATGMIAADAVNGDKIADNAVNSEHYTDGSIDHVHLANDIIDGDNIQNDVINSEHIAAGALDTEHYAANSVDAAALAHTAVTAGTYTAADITVDDQGRLTAAASGTIAGSEIAGDAIDGTKIADNAINSEHYTDGSIDRVHLASDIVDGSKIADDSLNSEHYAAGSIDHEHLANDIIDGDNIQDDVINSEHIAANAVDLEHMSANSVDSDQYVDGSIDRIHLEADIIDATKIADNAVTTDHIQDAELTTLAGMQSGTASRLADSTALTSTTAELNILDNKSFRASGDGALTTTSDTEIPSSKVVAAHVAAQLGTVGGFSTIATEVAFPATASQPAAGVIISISDAAGVVVNGSGVSTTGRTTDGTPATVTINSFPSSLNGETLASGVGLLVTSTGSGNTYTYHKILAAETDVKQLSDDINDFNARYRVAGSAPGSNNDAGDMYFDTSANKMKVYNGTTSTWDDVASVGNFYINTLSSSSGTGGGSATFNGSAYRFTLSNAPTMAQQLIVSVNGVIQKPDTGSSQPSEGFAISGNDILFSAAPASGSDYFIVTQGSSVSIGTPSDNTVSTAKIQNLAVTNAKIANDTIALTKLNTTGNLDIDGSVTADDIITAGALLHEGDTDTLVHFSAANTIDLKTGGVTRLTVNNTGVNLGANLYTSGKNISLGDSSGATDDRITVGDSQDLQIYHGGTDSIINNDTGDLYVQSDDQLILKSVGTTEIRKHAGDELMIKAVPDGAVELYYDNSKKFYTHSGGAYCSGNLGASDELYLPDNGKLVCGTGDDLQIYHDGSHSWLNNSTGALVLKGADVNIQNTSGDKLAYFHGDTAELWYDNNKKLETTSSGINVTGQINVNGSALSAAPEITAVATGSIGANAAVQLNSNGTVSVVSRATPAIGTKREFNNASSSHIAACYNPTDKVVAVSYKTSSGGAVRFGTVSGDEITFSAATQWSSDSVEMISMAHDNKDNAYFISYRNDNNGYGYVFALSANGTSYGTKSSSYTWTNNNAKNSSLVYAAFAEKIIFARINGSALLVQTLSYNGSSNPTNGSAVSSESSANGAPSLCVDETNSKAYLSYYNSNLTEGFTRILTVSGTSISQTNASTWHTYAAYYVKTAYDTTNSKLIVTFTDGQDGEKSKVRAGTINHSNNTISWSNSVEIDGSGYSSYTGATFNSDRGKIDYYGKDHDSYLYYVEIDASGTHPTCTTKVIVDNSSSNNNWGSAIFDTHTNQSFFFYQGESDHGDYISKDSGATTLTSENFIGFSSAAYTNGQTATINVVGNTTTQSSLTPAQKYYIQLDGTLGLTAADPNVEAGIALSSTKLLIKG